jgi:hypothetical protein
MQSSRGKVGTVLQELGHTWKSHSSGSCWSPGGLRRRRGVWDFGHPLVRRLAAAKALPHTLPPAGPANAPHSAAENTSKEQSRGALWSGVESVSTYP